MTINLELENKVAIVTGGGGGIGREIALALAAEGASVVVNDIGVSLTGGGGSDSPAEETCGLITQKGGKAVISNDSVSSWKSAQLIIQKALDTFGKIDIVINNAGILRDTIFHKMDPSDWEDVINVHLNGGFYVSRAAAPYFREQSSGAYVHMTSTSGLIGNFGQANYSAAKLGIAGLSKSISLDMSRFNVRSNCIAPFAWSRMTSSIPANTDAEKERVERLKKMTPETNAPLAVFLASGAAKDVTGQIFSARLNELFIYNQSRPIKSVHSDKGWTPQEIAERAYPAFKTSMTPNERSGDVFSWDPI
ncbi:SDR family NAD(P)-dependent oxidoreductase [Alphaproteobacteria bacterium]|jgi:NAD(P)-dependent dehydrogenase (short-subunit alcohol dehydrogenase family)|nr:SDR family NAD(P)-dependent oxidoreductase [Alphaproteobacteria bacterium]MDC1209372.1 SDR family NAD(P)-dependent oxidoreductase [Pseudomonadota bacterium]|tara:strand:- start:2558 stop:3478 length:921 start_codon:yes stop_codon:yes gene_type:complete